MNAGIILLAWAAIIIVFVAVALCSGLVDVRVEFNEKKDKPDNQDEEDEEK